MPEAFAVKPQRAEASSLLFGLWHGFSCIWMPEYDKVQRDKQATKLISEKSGSVSPARESIWLSEVSRFRNIWLCR